MPRHVQGAALSASGIISVAGAVAATNRDRRRRIAFARRTPPSAVWVEHDTCGSFVVMTCLFVSSQSHDEKPLFGFSAHAGQATRDLHDEWCGIHISVALG